MSTRQLGGRDPDGQENSYGQPQLHDTTVLRAIIQIKRAIALAFFWLMGLTAIMIGMLQR